MNIQQRQITLETKMYRDNSFGKADICNKCWASTHISCIADNRSIQCLCAKAEARLHGPKFGKTSRPDKLTFGLRRNDYDNS